MLGAYAHAGRYPKRQLHNEWRQLAALILGVSELTMCEDIKHPKYFEVCVYVCGLRCVGPSAGS